MVIEFTTTMEKMLEHLIFDSEVASTLLQCSLIKSDMEIFVNLFKMQDIEHCTYYVAMREKGVEFSTRKKEVEDRCKVLGHPFAVYVIRIASSTEEVFIRKKVFNR